jgi:hypothetical protein
MGLAFQTILFVIINVIVGSLLVLSQGQAGQLTTISDPLLDNASVTSASYGDLKDTDQYKVSNDDMQDAGFPQWLINILLLIDGIWLIAILYGWFRGVS